MPLVECERRREHPQGVCLRRFRAWDDEVVTDPLPEHAGQGGALEHRRGGELTPAERRLRRRNRKLMAWVAVPGLLLGSAALAASVVSSGGPTPPKPLRVPAGYQAVDDGVFAYSIPRSWSKNLAFSDDTGDLDYSGADGWAGEYLGARSSAAQPGERPPASFEDFGQNRPTPYVIGPARQVHVEGATVAFTYEVTRPGGFTAVAIDAWQSSSGAEIWLLVHAPPSVTTTIVSTLSG